MRITRDFGIVVLAAALAAALRAEHPANPAWEKMKTLVGEWTGESPEGKFRSSYKLVSGGSALMETINAPHDFDMVTVYHPDGKSLAMTHYCGIGNQPRMRSNGLDPEGRKVAFDFVDATNVSSPDQLRMVRLVVTFGDADHFTQEWTSREKGKDTTGVFKLTRANR